MDSFGWLWIGSIAGLSWT